MSDEPETEPAETFNDIIRRRLNEKAFRTPQEIAEDAIEAASNSTFNALIRGTATDEDHGS